MKTDIMFILSFDGDIGLVCGLRCFLHRVARFLLNFILCSKDNVDHKTITADLPISIEVYAYVHYIIIISMSILGEM